MLRYLIAFGQIRVEIVFSGKVIVALDGTITRKSELDGQRHSLSVCFG
jgi:hypothetical protein